ncbi:MAG TPA: nitroreductase family protein [Acidimicrobiales bacterium]|nr:nitroreductase family protein [Acidimicrobiales bacterium]
MELHEALYTTRAMRRVTSEPIPLDAQARMMDAAIRAPSGGNTQGWRFLLVDDPALIARVGPLYRDAMDQLWRTVYRDRIEAAQRAPEDAASVAFTKVRTSAQWLADHFETVPLYLFAFSRFDPSGGSIYPAVWSAMLAARAEGVGSCLTAVLSAFHHDEVLELLGVPADKGWRMSACVSFGYPTGRWGIAPRRAVQDVTHRNRWGAPAGFEVEAPLWSGDQARLRASTSR